MGPRGSTSREQTTGCCGAGSFFDNLTIVRAAHRFTVNLVKRSLDVWSAASTSAKEGCWDSEGGEIGHVYTGFARRRSWASLPTREPQVLGKSGEPPGTRTPNPLIKSQLLLQAVGVG